MMKKANLVQFILFIFLLQSCATLNTSQSSNEGEVAYKEGNFEAALNYWEQIIEKKGKRTKAPVYAGAGKSALALGQNDKARNYLETAKGLKYSSPELYSSLAKVYKNIDNLSKEITALETYRKKYPGGNEINEITARLFETYVESENWDLAMKLWPAIEAQAQTNTSLLAGYLIVNKNLENSSNAQKIAGQILKQDASNITALEWYAEHYFWEAENLYVSEMKAYKGHRTRSQYNKLLKALDKVYPTFRKSRDCFLKLYKLEPKPEYAKYLGNIYTRLDDKQKAAYYYKRAN